MRRLLKKLSKKNEESIRDVIIEIRQILENVNGVRLNSLTIRELINLFTVVSNYLPIQANEINPDILNDEVTQIIFLLTKGRDSVKLGSRDKLLGLLEALNSFFGFLVPVDWFDKFRKGWKIQAVTAGTFKSCNCTLAWIDDSGAIMHCLCHIPKLDFFDEEK